MPVKKKAITKKVIKKTTKVKTKKKVEVKKKPPAKKKQPVKKIPKKKFNNKFTVIVPINETLTFQSKLFIPKSK